MTKILKRHGLEPISTNPFYRKLCLMNARLKAFQEVFYDKRKPRFYKEKETKSASPNGKRKTKTMFDIATNIRITEKKTPPKISEVKLDANPVLDLNVQKVMKSPASEQRFTPFKEVLQ